ncbi:hypothetical protein AVEN_134036-1 [Araneus ventricosus]|uniref:Uncharacterized protein n=1 Tax=Araneus ventricosus TaxID=182803 RepID=A0A4Y2K4I2_ARAVE|nr:hypothetical protein AVEN_134036-1 [Araneus ventricosus]
MASVRLSGCAVLCKEVKGTRTCLEEMVPEYPAANNTVPTCFPVPNPCPMDNVHNGELQSYRPENRVQSLLFHLPDPQFPGYLSLRMWVESGRNPFLQPIGGKHRFRNLN